MVIKEILEPANGNNDLDICLSSWISDHSRAAPVMTSTCSWIPLSLNIGVLDADEILINIKWIHLSEARSMLGMSGIELCDHAYD